ncbi:MAG: hypothetical protein MK135_16150, partial [Polyangiaceae bacterium]|nr:hypothetical protein [Polyangiaceae bacterium]
LIVVQGFETSRFMGKEFSAQVRVRTMRRAQILSGLIYIIFFLLLSPLLGTLSEGSGVAAIISVSALVSLLLPWALTLGATASQLSASVADSVGNVGLLGQLTHGKLDGRHAYVLVAVVGTGILVASDVNQVIALASRAFALFYCLQSAVAWEAARRRPQDRKESWFFAFLAVIAAAVFIFGVPEG